MKLKFAVSILLLLGFLWLSDLSFDLSGRWTEKQEPERPVKDGESTFVLQFVSLSGAPVPDAAVTLQGPGGIIGTGRSDKQGRFFHTSQIWVDSLYRLQASHPQFESIDWNLRGFWLGAEKDQVVSLVAKGSLQDIHLRYLCDEDHQLEVSWSWCLGSPGFVSQGRSLALTVMPQQGVAKVQVSQVPRGAIFEVVARDPVSGEGDCFKSRISLRQPAIERQLQGLTLRGRIENEDGVALQGARILVVEVVGVRTPSGLAALTDELGEYEIDVPAWWFTPIGEGETFGFCDLFLGPDNSPERRLIRQGERFQTIVLKTAQRTSTSIK